MLFLSIEILLVLYPDSHTIPDSALIVFALLGFIELAMEIALTAHYLVRTGTI